jgi:hypothetical protein
MIREVVVEHCFSVSSSEGDGTAQHVYLQLALQSYSCAMLFLLYSEVCTQARRSNISTSNLHQPSSSLINSYQQLATHQLKTKQIKAVTREV